MKLFSTLYVENKYKHNINPNIYLGAKYPNDAGGTMICQLRTYLEKSNVNVTTLFNDNPPKDLKVSLKSSKIDYQGQPNLDAQRRYR